MTERKDEVYKLESVKTRLNEVRVDPFYKGGDKIATIAAPAHPHTYTCQNQEPFLNV